MKNKKVLPIIISSVIVIISIVIFVVIKITSFKGYEEGTTANTPLNLINGGMFCEDDNRIYFSNPKDHNYLYSMSLDLTDFKLIKKNSVSYINAKAPYIFYSVLDSKKTAYSVFGIKNTGIYRTNINNGNTKIIDENPTALIALYGNDIYYQHYEVSQGLTLYKADINGKVKEQLDKNPYLPATFQEGRIICPSIDNNQYISSYNIDSGNLSTLKSIRATNIGVTGNYYYYMDLDSDYALKRVNKNGENITTLTEQRCSSYNFSVGNKYMYYQIDDGENNGLYKMNLSTLKSTLIKEGNFKNICTTTDYVFFTDMNELVIYYCEYDNDKVETLSPPTLSE